MGKRAVVLILLLVALVQAPAAYGELPKDPFLAAAFSWFVPGLGQTYVGDPVKGGVFWAVDNLLFWGTILNIADIKLELVGDFGFSFSVHFKKEPSSARVWTTVGLGLCYLAFHIYNVIDASEDAHRHNRRLFLKQLKQEGFSLRLDPYLTGVAWSLRF